MRCIEMAVLFLVSTAVCAVVPPNTTNPNATYKQDVAAAKAKLTAALPAYNEALAKARKDWQNEANRCAALPKPERKACADANDAKFSVRAKATKS